MGPDAFFEALDVVGARRDLVALGGRIDAADAAGRLPGRLLPLAAVGP